MTTANRRGIGTDVRRWYGERGLCVRLAQEGRMRRIACQVVHEAREEATGVYPPDTVAVAEAGALIALAAREGGWPLEECWARAQVFGASVRRRQMRRASLIEMQDNQEQVES